MTTDRRACPDGGTCHHACMDGPCARVIMASPLSGVFPGDRWPTAVRAANDALRLTERQVTQRGLALADKEGREVFIPETTLEELAEISATDLAFQAVEPVQVPYDQGLVLIEAGLAQRSTRGSLYGTDALRQLIDKDTGAASIPYALISNAPTWRITMHQDPGAPIRAQDRHGVHSSHCCKRHGCKYGESTCPVLDGRAAQKYPCEQCTDPDDDEQGN